MYVGLYDAFISPISRIPSGYYPLRQLSLRGIASVDKAICGSPQDGRLTKFGLRADRGRSAAFWVGLSLARYLGYAQAGLGRLWPKDYGPWEQDGRGKHWAATADPLRG